VCEYRTSPSHGFSRGTCFSFFFPSSSFFRACRNAILLSERRAKERAERLAKLRAGQPTGAPKRSKEQQAIAKKFYGQLVVDSEYQGEDYEVFDKWLGTAQ
jgi:hypothetical protein